MPDQSNNGAQLLSLTRAARLVGVTRGALQNKIKKGELPTFEGMVRPKDLLRVYPDTQLDNSSELERFTHIKDEAFAHRVRERLLPEPEVLAERLSGLGKELAKTRAQVERYKKPSPTGCMTNSASTKSPAVRTSVSSWGRSSCGCGMNWRSSRPATIFSPTSSRRVSSGS